MCNYLHGPRQGGMYYFRRGIPEHLRPIVGRREWFFSLKTKDRAEAKRRVLQIESPRYDTLLQAAQDEYARQPQTVTPLPASDPFAGMTLEEFEDWQQQDREQLWQLSAEDDRMEEAEAWAATLPADHKAALLLREAQENLNRYRDRYRRRKRRDQKQEAAPAIAAPHSSASLQSDTVSLTELFDDYAEKRLSPAIAKEWRSGINRFVAFVGHDNAKAVTKEDVKQWRDHVAAEPQRNGKPRSPQRVNAGYLAPLRAAFKYGVRETLLEHDPAAIVGKLLVEKKSETRDRLFAKREWQTILSASLRTENDPSASSYRRLARRWVPWLCAYSGARVNEITQLRAEDVQQVEGHWIIKVTRTKTRSFSNVPVHEHLIAQGFLAFVKAQGEGPLFYDPELGNAESVRGQNIKVGQRLASWVRDLGITDPGIMPNHAWRHTFTSRAMDAKMDERASNYITGHASVGVSRKTYTHHTVGPLAQQMALFPRYDLGEPEPV